MSLSGVLLVDKPGGMTSHDVVAFLRRKLQMKEIGHAGTLDPMAEGLLVCLLGEATKLSDFLLNEEKGYRAKVQFGLRTDTLDLEGQVVEEGPVKLVGPQVLLAVQKLTGLFQWPVPIFSAVKKDGKKLYEHARDGETVELPVRSMEFKSAELVKFETPFCEVDLMCSKGSFIRTWADQLGRHLNTPATLAGLRRVYSSPFSVNQALPLADIERFDIEVLASHPAFIPFDSCLANLRGLSVKGKELRLLQNGQIAHDVERRLVPDQRDVNTQGREIFYRVLDGETGLMVAIIHLSPMVPAKIRRVFKRP